MELPLSAMLLLSVIVIGMVAVPALAEPAKSPHKQYMMGVPLEEIQCVPSKTLMESPSGSPVCVTDNYVARLAGIGYMAVESAVIPQSIADANNKFMFDFYGQVSNNADNIFFSPTGMYTAFSVLYEGARENTAIQMEDVFGLEPDEALRHNATAHMISSINRDDPDATLDIANAVWLNEPPHESYIETARNIYHADAEHIPLDAEGAGMINDWASEKTNGKITDVIDAGSLADALMVITNAIYFKGTWVSHFDPKETRPLDFKTNSTVSVKTDFMNMEDTLNYAQMDGVQVLKMSYKGDRLSMLVILPEDTDGISALEGRLSVELLEEWRQNLNPVQVIVSIPKFTMSTHYDLNGPLITLGMPDAFSNDTANFQGIFPHSFIGLATQDAFVDVNEEGTEAAAVTTAGIILDSSSHSPQTPRFIADHPFIFMIQDDESGTILFMGRLSSPPP